MNYIVNAEEMRRADENTISYFGVPQLVLMERAALAAKEFIMGEWPELFAGSARILIAVGNGNNGGDGAALARLFYLAGHRVTVLVSGDENKYSSALKSQMKILGQYQAEGERKERSKQGRALHTVTDEVWKGAYRQRKVEFDLVVDALFGVGLSRPLGGIYQEKVEWLNGLSAKKAALDIPSGISAQDGSVPGEAFLADVTVTFGFVKTGMLLYPGKAFCGQVKRAEIGITKESFLGEYPAGITLPETSETLSACRTFLGRKPDSHKGSYGKVLLLAGSKETPGAALLAGKAAFRSGAGMVRLVTSPENRDFILGMLPEIMYQEHREDTDWESLLAWCDAVVAGPGIGQGQLAGGSLQKILTLMSEKKLYRPLVLDADGLNLAAASEELFRLIRGYTATGGIVIMTPHRAELARLLHCNIKELQTGCMEKTEAYVRESGGILVAKDAATVVCYTDEKDRFHYYINQTGNNGMATAGCGDVLSGITGAFAALVSVRQRSREKESGRAAYFEAAYRAVCVHGFAGDKAVSKYGETSMKAGDIIDALPEILMDSGMFQNAVRSVYGY